MLKILGAVIISLAFADTALAQQPPFQTGQKWAVKDSSMTVVIGVIEPFGNDKTAISVSVFGVPCPPAAGCVTTDVAHAPFDSQTLAASVDKLLDQNVPVAPAFAEGYANWKNAKGGMFTVPVSELPKLLFQAITNGKPTQRP